MRPAIIATQMWLSAKFADELSIEHFIHRYDAETGAVAQSSIEVRRRKNLVQQISFVFRDNDLSVYMELFVIHKVAPRPDFKRERSRMATLSYADPQFFEQLEAATRQMLNKCSEDLLPE